MAEIIHLTVGGVNYLTTRTTLTKFPNSMIGVMFSGQFATTQLSDGSFFIDRDGQIFKYVLNFLRSGQLTLPKDFKDLSQLKLEVEFYQILPLVEIVSLLFRKQLEQEEKQLEREELNSFFEEESFLEIFIL